LLSTIGTRVANPDPRQTLVAQLREHALVIGEVTLTSGRTAQYYVDAKRAILLPAGFKALGQLVRQEAELAGVTAVGGMTMGADPIACAALAAGADVKAFFVRKERKEHGLQRWVEGPMLGDGERCLVVEDVVTTGGSTMHALEKLRDEGREIVGVVSVLDRLAGGAEAIEKAAAAPYIPLTTIDDVYPERPDREKTG
jgi:orotate phosphoribosyltransferase